jgi:choline dehydrogenase-like flavoprotein
MAADEYDYLIVGAGTAGCVLAARLSEDPDIKVCLIEAGPRDTHPAIQVPALVGVAISRPTLNWRFMTEPQANLDNRQIPLPRGRVVGGSGWISTTGPGPVAPAGAGAKYCPTSSARSTTRTSPTRRTTATTARSTCGTSGDPTS